MSDGAVPGQGWIPLDARWRGEEFCVDWCHLGDAPLREPFFDDTLAQCLMLPFNQLFRPRTPIAALGDRARSGPGLAPSGFVFHMSRCGSTLLAQMLAALPRTVVLAEAGPIDAVLRAADGRASPSEDERALWLRWMIGALGRPRRGDETRLFVKFDCWHTLDLPLIRRAFPSVPCLFLYRDPLEVLASHLRRRGVQTVPGLVAPGLFGIDPVLAVQMPAEEYCARVLAAICDAAVRHGPGSGALLVNYRDLPQAQLPVIARHFRLDCSDADRAAMAAVAQHHAYTPGTPFVPDAGRVQALPDRARAAVETWLEPVYRRLEALRG